MRLTKREVLVAFCSATFALGAMLAMAAHGGGAARLLPYQGRLELNGAPADGLFAVDFRLFDAETGGATLWTETHDQANAIAAKEGALAATLGELQPIADSVFDRSELWLEVVVDGQVLSPRQRIVPAAYAVSAKEASSFHVATDVYWSTGGWLRNDQGGSIELGEGAVGATPYIDFHHNGSTVDHTTRIVTYAGGLALQGPSDDLFVHGDVSATTVNATTVNASAVNANATKLCSIFVPGVWRSDFPVPGSWVNQDCIDFALSVGASSHQLGCLWKDPVSIGGTLRRFSLGGPSIAPSPNCGW